MVKNAHKEFFQDHAALYASLLISKQFILVSPGELVRDNEGKVIGCKVYNPKVEVIVLNKSLDRFLLCGNI